MSETLQVLVQLVLLLAPLSLVMVGGALSVLPEIHRQVVQQHGWLTDAEFADLFAIAQAVPGPNVLYISLVGWKLAGLLGALVALIAALGPSSVLAYGLAQAVRRYQGMLWLRVIQRGLAPIAVGFVLASGVILGVAADTSPLAFLVTAVTMLLVLRTSLHPLLLMAAAATLGLAGWL